MNDLEQAEALARWLDTGGPPPEGLDPEVVEAVLAMRPELAPASGVTVAEIEGLVGGGGGAVLPFPTPASRRAAETPRPRRLPAGFIGLLAAAAVLLVVVQVRPLPTSLFGSPEAPQGTEEAPAPASTTEPDPADAAPSDPRGAAEDARVDQDRQVAQPADLRQATQDAAPAPPRPARARAPQPAAASGTREDRPNLGPPPAPQRAMSEPTPRGAPTPSAAPTGLGLRAEDAAGGGGGGSSGYGGSADSVRGTGRSSGLSADGFGTSGRGAAGRASERFVAPPAPRPGASSDEAKREGTASAPRSDLGGLLDMELEPTETPASATSPRTRRSKVAASEGAPPAARDDVVPEQARPAALAEAELDADRPSGRAAQTDGSVDASRTSADALIDAAADRARRGDPLGAARSLQPYIRAPRQDGQRVALAAWRHAVQAGELELAAALRQAGLGLGGEGSPEHRALTALPAEP